ncbi:MAG: hypothetical protein KKG00_14965 [Bacteroidetes bacterium]|nr:hypothetical protein [Bacteroidota bacterium]
MGKTYPNGILPLYEGGVTVEASSKIYDACDQTRIILGIDRALTSKAQLDLSFNFPAEVGYFKGYHYDGQWNLCSTDSVHTSVSVGERPSPGSIDLMGLAAYRIIDDSDNFLEVTRYDEKKRWIEGRFRLRAVRYGVMSYPLPLADTLVITNGEFGFGFRRE